MKLQVGMKVRIKNLGEHERTNVYEVAGISRFGWAWLTLIETPNFDDPLEYDGYNADMLLRNDLGGWTLGFGDGRNDLENGVNKRAELEEVK